MKTKHKIALAKSGYHVVSALRSVIGKSDSCSVTRRGIRYELDLAQGIDFAIFMGGFEADTMAACARYIKPGNTVLDIGANIGAITLELAKAVRPRGRVLAFEPTKFAFDKLSRNIRLNPDLSPRIQAVQTFLGAADDDKAPPEIHSSWPLAGGTDLHVKHLGEAKTTAGASMRRLDTILAENGIGRVDVVKLDVDGFECEVLAGAEKLFATSAPVFFIELAPYVHAERGHSFKQFLAMFSSRGYKFFEQRSNRPVPNDPDQLEKMIGDGAGINVVART